MIKRIGVVLLFALVLSGCGIGGDKPTATPPATATARPEPTARPTATAIAEPTAAPTSEPGGTSGDVSIPAPPNSEPYVAGEDPIVDAAITAMEAEFANQTGSGLDLQDLTFYLSNGKVDDLVTFYETEMPNNGWATGQTQDQDFGKVLAYVGKDLTTVGLVGILDLATAGAKGLIIFTTIGTPTEGGAVLPTTAPVAGGGGGTGSNANEVPAPPQGTPVVEGQNSSVDLFVSLIKPALEQSLGSNGQLDSQGTFTTPTSLKDVVSFYQTEMAALGWTELTNDTTTPGNATLAYSSGTNAAVIYISDGKDLGIDETFVLTLNLSQ